MLGGLVGHVLPDAVMTGAGERKDGREPAKAGRDTAREKIERVAVDHHRQIRDPLVRCRYWRVGHRALRA